METTRRTFLGLIGSAVVAASTPEWFSAQRAQSVLSTPHPDLSRVWLTTLELVNESRDEGLVDVRRVGHRDPLIRMYARPYAHLRWETCCCTGLVFPQGQASLVITGPVSTWTAWWKDEATGEYSLSGVMRLGGRAMPIRGDIRRTYVRGVR